MGTGLSAPEPPPARGFQPDRFEAWLARALTGKLVRCDGVSIEADGHLTLRLASDKDAVALRWGPLVREEGARDGAHLSAPNGALRPATAEDAARPWGHFARYAATRLTQVLGKYRVPFLDLLRLDEPREVFLVEPGLFRWRIADFLQAGETRWGPYVYAGEHFDGECLRYRFESAAANVVLRLDVDESGGAGRPGAAFCTRHLSVTIETDERAPAERAQPEHQVERYLGFLLSLCDPPSARYALRHRTEGIVVGSTQDWGADLSLQFYADPGYDYLANFYTAFGLRWGVALLYHGERECSHMGTFTPAPVQSFVEHPLHVRPTRHMARRVFVTDLAEADAALGGEERLRAALRAVARQEGVEAVIVQDTCVVRVMGDDIRRCMDEVRAEVDVPLIYLDATAMDEGAPFTPIIQFWRELLSLTAEPPEAAPAGAAGRVNLVGYGELDSPPVAELAALLAERGVTVNAALFPGLTRAEARRFRQAAANVVTPFEYARRSFEGVEAWSGLPTLEPPLPYGPTATQAWLQAVAAASGAGGGPAPAGGELGSPVPAPLAERLHALRAATGALEAGVVLVSTQAPRVLDPARTIGVPLLPFLADLGFRVRVVCHDPPRVRAARERTDPAAIEAGVRAQLPEGAAFTFEAFSDPAELPRILAGPGLDLVYSEIRDDPRLRAAGKAQLTVCDLELGFAGAVRTAERLVRLARVPFAQRFRRFLQPPATDRSQEP